MNCESIQQQLSPFLDGELSTEEASAVSTHLEICSECQLEAVELRDLNRQLKEAQSMNAPHVNAVTAGVLAQLTTSLPSNTTASRLKPVLFWLTGVAAGFLLALLVLSNSQDANDLEQIARKDDAPAIQSSVPSADNTETRQNLDPPNLAFVGTVTSTIGTVSVSDWSEPDQSSLPVLSAFRCPSESVIETGYDACCEIELANGSLVRLSDRTKVVLRSSQDVEIHEGQVMCNSPNDASLNVVAVSTKQATRSGTAKPSLDLKMTCQPSGTFWTSNGPHGLTVTSAAGDVNVRTGNGNVSLKSGESVSIVNEQIQPVSQTGLDPLLSTRWIHPLLVKKGPADAELKKRVDAMLANIGYSKLSSLYESEIRSLGEYSVLPLIRYLESPEAEKEPEKRKIAARIVGDLATSWAIGDLILLLQSKDGTVRESASSALSRLTGINFGIDSKQWREQTHPEQLTRWKNWWKENRQFYPSLEELSSGRGTKEL